MENNTGGIGFLSALTILFIALKLLDKIDWSWWWVLSPIWVVPLLIAVILLVLLVVAFLR